MADKKTYTTKPTTLLDLEAREAAVTETEKQRVKRVNDEFDANALPEGYVGIDPIYANAADVTHEPFASEEGAEAAAEERALEALDQRDQNSRQAAGGFLTYGATVEADPLDRGADIVRGGPGLPTTVTPASTPSKSTSGDEPKTESKSAPVKG